MQTDAEKEAERKLKEFDEIIKNGAGVDKAALALAALDSAQSADLVSPKARRWAYLVSIGLPPFGLLFAIRYFFSAKQNAKSVAIVCVVLTVLGGFLVWLSLKSFQSVIPLSMTGQLNTGQLNIDQLNMGQLNMEGLDMEQIDLNQLKSINAEELKKLIE